MINAGWVAGRTDETLSRQTCWMSVGRTKWTERWTDTFIEREDDYLAGGREWRTWEDRQRYKVMTGFLAMSCFTGEWTEWLFYKLYTCCWGQTEDEHKGSLGRRDKKQVKQHQQENLIFAYPARFGRSTRDMTCVVVKGWRTCRHRTSSSSRSYSVLW